MTLRSRLAAASWLAPAYLALAVVATYPLAFHAHEAVIPSADTYLNLWALGWVAHQLPRAPLEIFDGNVFYPHARSLAFSEHLFVPTLLAAPWIALTGNLALAHNCVLLLTLALAGLGMHLLCLEVTGSHVAAFGGGLLYAFHSWNVNELVRLQIVSNQWFPLHLLALLCFFREPSRRPAVWVGVTYLLQSLSCMYWALYLPLVTATAVTFLAWRYRRGPRELLGLAAPLLGALVTTMTFVVPYVLNAAAYGFRRAAPEALPPGRYLAVLPGSLLYGGVLEVGRQNQGAPHFLGFVALALALLGLAPRGAGAAGSQAIRSLFVTLAAGGFLLSLGPEIALGPVSLPGPYGLLYAWLPGFHSVRYPERFALVLMLGLAPLVALGLDRLRPRVGRYASAAIVGVLFLEHVSTPLGLATLPSRQGAPRVYHWAAQDAKVRVLAEVPAPGYWMRRSDALPMYFSTVHWKHTIQGFTGFFPPAYNFIHWRLFHFPDPESVDTLRRLGVDTVIVRPEKGVKPPAWVWSRNDWTMVGPFPEGHVALRLEGGRPPIEDPGEEHGAGALRELERTGWRVKASAPGERAAIDGDSATFWSTYESQRDGDFYAVRFPRPVAVARVTLDLGGPCEFPMHLRLRGQTPEGDHVSLSFGEKTAYELLLSRLLRRPRDRRLDIDLDSPQRLKKLVLEIPVTDGYAMPWTIAEVRLFERPHVPGRARAALAPP